MRKIYQVFVSSTYEDLKDERQEVIKALLKENCLPVGMELFTSEDKKQIKVIQRKIAEADFYVIIVAGKYGSMYSGKSFTQCEYEYAVKKNKKIIRLLLDDKAVDKLPLEKSETDPDKRRKLIELRNSIKNNKLVAFWETKDGLGRELAHAVHALIASQTKGGWIQYSKENIDMIVADHVGAIGHGNKRLEEKLASVSKENYELKKERTLYGGLEANASSDITVIKLLKDMEALDKQINDNNQLLSSRDGSVVKFSSRDIADSLHVMGIPTTASLDITRQCIDEIIISKNKNDKISTNDVRRKIVNIIYKLNKEKYSEQDIKNWADIYVRKYGSPETRISLVVKDAKGKYDEEPLTYKYLRGAFLDRLLMDIIGEDEYSQIRKEGQNKNLDRIPEKILSKVKMLDINKISYETLSCISKDLITQTPHPCVILRSNESLRSYDFEMALRHVKNIIDKNTQYNAFYSINECIHHSSSGLLSLYKQYVGCGTMSPYYRLLFLVKRSVNKASKKIESDKFAQDIFRDLDSIRIDLKEFYAVLSELEVMLANKLYRKYEYVNNEMIEPALRLFILYARIFLNYYPNRFDLLGKCPDEIRCKIQAA